MDTAGITAIFATLPWLAASNASRVVSQVAPGKRPHGMKSHFSMHLKRIGVRIPSRISIFFKNNAADQKICSGSAPCNGKYPTS